MTITFSAEETSWPSLAQDCHDAFAAEIVIEPSLKTTKKITCVNCYWRFALFWHFWSTHPFLQTLFQYLCVLFYSNFFLISLFLFAGGVHCPCLAICWSGVRSIYSLRISCYSYIISCRVSCSGYIPHSYCIFPWFLSWLPLEIGFTFKYGFVYSLLYILYYTYRRSTLYCFVL